MSKKIIRSNKRQRYRKSGRSESGRRGSSSCYYGNQICRGVLWECRTCGEMFCQAHHHQTSKGRNVECVACERNRKEKESLEKESLEKGLLEREDR